VQSVSDIAECKDTAVHEEAYRGLALAFNTTRNYHRSLSLRLLVEWSKLLRLHMAIEDLPPNSKMLKRSVVDKILRHSHGTTVYTIEDLPMFDKLHAKWLLLRALLQEESDERFWLLLTCAPVLSSLLTGQKLARLAKDQSWRHLQHDAQQRHTMWLHLLDSRVEKALPR